MQLKPIATIYSITGKHIPGSYNHNCVMLGRLTANSRAPYFLYQSKQKHNQKIQRYTQSEIMQPTICLQNMAKPY